MASVRMLTTWLAAAAAVGAAEPGLELAEVRLPYPELRHLIEAAGPAGDRPPEPSAGLVAARLHFTVADGVPGLDARFQVVRFGDHRSLVPLVGGGVAFDRLDPEAAPLVVDQGMVCHAGTTAGTTAVGARLIAPAGGGDAIALVLPPCPTLMLEIGNLPEDAGVAVRSGGHERVLGAGGRIALPATGGAVELRLLPAGQAREALRPPVPSEWSWQHQVLVTPGEGELVHHVLARGAAASGSGLAATLILPADARAVEANGEDLTEARASRDADGLLRLRLAWTTRGVLDRELAICYRVPLRPLDGRWNLTSPAGETAGGTRARFLVAASPRLAYAADGMAGPLAAEGAPATFARELAGQPFYQIEGGDQVAVAIRRLSVVATADAVVGAADWSLRVEPDGALLAEGTLAIEHRGPQRVVIDTPDGMTLLACELAGTRAEPVDLGEGRLEFALPPAAGGKATVLACSFTGRSEPLDPVEGTLALALPRTRLFIRALTWRIELPAGYRAEVNGNLTREAKSSGEPPSTLRLCKNLCRDERPELRVFYQRADLAP